MALRDELMASAAELIKAETEAGFAGPDTAVRVKDPAHLAHLLTRAGSALQVRQQSALLDRITAAEARAEEAEARANTLEKACAEDWFCGELGEIGLWAFATMPPPPPTATGSPMRWRAPRPLCGCSCRS
jgi:hypothetical protein